MKLHTKRKAFIQIVWVSPQPSLTGLPSGTSIQESATIWGYSGFAIRKAPRKQKCQKHWNASTESAYLNRKAGERLILLKIYTKFHEYYNFVCVRFPSFLTLMDCLNQPNISNSQNVSGCSSATRTETASLPPETNTVIAYRKYRNDCCLAKQ